MLPQESNSSSSSSSSSSLSSSSSSGWSHFAVEAIPHSILLHFPMILSHFPIDFDSFPHNLASFPHNSVSFTHDIVAFPHKLLSHFPILFWVTFPKMSYILKVVPKISQGCQLALGHKKTWKAEILVGHENSQSSDILHIQKIHPATTSLSCQRLPPAHHQGGELHWADHQTSQKKCINAHKGNCRNREEKGTYHTVLDM